MLVLEAHEETTKLILFVDFVAFTIFDNIIVIVFMKEENKMIDVRGKWALITGARALISYGRSINFIIWFTVYSLRFKV